MLIYLTTPSPLSAAKNLSPSQVGSISNHGGNYYQLSYNCTAVQ